MTATLREHSLQDRYTLVDDTVLLSGIQALVRALIEQRRQDERDGLNTAGFASGYRGSPLGGLDREIMRQQATLGDHHIQFRAGINEELAAMGVWGSQQVNLYPGARYDGVFGMWYGKGAGLDRSIDVLRHANAAGSSPNGGALAIIGDDHMAKSSSQPHNCEVTCSDVQMPLLYPSNVQEVIDYALAGWAMSRYSACWTALKMLPEIADATSTTFVGNSRNFVRPPVEDGIHIRTPDPFLEQESRLVRVKVEAARRFARANGLDHAIFRAARPRLGLVASGKAYRDTIEAIRLLGLNMQQAAELGLSLFKVAMPFPLDTDTISRFAQGHEEIIVIEEKRPVMEQQLKDALYNTPGDRPRIVGKQDGDGSLLIPRDGETTPDLLARIIGKRLLDHHDLSDVQTRMEGLADTEPGPSPAPIIRTPFYCAGCPHNTSTRVPEGSRAIAGIGCHSLAVGMDRATDGMTVMGGEGSTWIGQEPFTEQTHVFTNMGDGTYFHSGIMPVRAAVSAKSTITFKILFNDAVAMTGGQSFDGPLTVPDLTRQVSAEGVETIVVVSDEPEKYAAGTGLASGARVAHRDDLDTIQKELRETRGVSVLIYDQTCAAEKRRRRKRGTMNDPDMRAFINERVCEGCGDCSVQSNCIAVEPVETAFGRKRRINQSACNKDFSCVKGFCPSFVTVSGIEPKPELERPAPPEVGDISPAAPDGPYRILFAGIGGTGVVTASALLAMAAHLEGKACTALDATGMAQKGGAVSSHITIAANEADLGAARIPLRAADLVVAADMVFASSEEMLTRLAPHKSRVVLNANIAPVGDFTRQPNLDFQERRLRSRIGEALHDDSRIDAFAAAELSTRLLGDTIGSNMLLLGYAYQKGLLPVGREAIEQAIELNGAAVEMNLRAFAWGRAIANDPDLVARALENRPEQRDPETLESLVERNAGELAEYQDETYAERYRKLVRRAEQAEHDKTPGRQEFGGAVARFGFKLMAYKDEYEVARLYADPAFRKDLKDSVGNARSTRVHLSPPFLARRDPATGRPGKIAFGQWIFPLFGILARFKRLRGTPFDPFGWTRERRAERLLIEEYEATVADLCSNLDEGNHEIAVALARLPDQIRGFGFIKMASIEKAGEERAALIERFHGAAAPSLAAE